MKYSEFLSMKSSYGVAPTGLDADNIEINPMLMPFQSDLVRWALRRGRACIFADCGLGKTPMQLEWANHIPGPVLIVAPLAVSQQTCREGNKFHIPVMPVSNQSEVTEHISITNYERLHRFKLSEFTGIVLDESSIIKNHDGKTRNSLIDNARSIPFKLACTATPAPNDHMELGNHAEFLGTMTRQEMLSMFFVHDGGEVQKWRLKGHAVDLFWRWVASWAATLQRPSDLGYDDDGFTLPELRYHEQSVDVTPNEFSTTLFPIEAITLQERQSARRESIDARVRATADIVATRPNEAWVIWCNLNGESTSIANAIPDAVEITGSHQLELKESRMMGFSDGTHRVIVTKPTIAGHGMNWQHCSNVVFVGLSDSWEQWYQAIRRCWRFGQMHPVDVFIVTATTEGAVVRNIRRKEHQSAELMVGVVAHTRTSLMEDIHGMTHDTADYVTGTTRGNGWAMHNGDCVDHVGKMADDSIDYTVFSPPFASLYTYSNSDRDMGNCKSRAEFANHFNYLVGELIRVTKSGRLLSFHCMNLPTSKTRDGVIGISDFRGELIRMFVDAGWIFHSEVVIWKDPVTAMQRTKALGLLYKQLRKDSAMSRQGIPDYLVTMRKPGDNTEPVTKTHDGFPVQLWQERASPVWMDINPSDTLQKQSAREDKDERHIAPLQLTVIRRAVELWTNPGDTVLSPFAGIGSEGYVSIEVGRQFVGVELKESYYKQACANLHNAESTACDLFSQPRTA